MMTIKKAHLNSKERRGGNEKNQNFVDRKSTQHSVPVAGISNFRSKAIHHQYDTSFHFFMSSG